MKKYEVELQYTTYALYAVEANSKEEAEAKAWELLKNDPTHDYGEWQLESIEEVTETENTK